MNLKKKFKSWKNADESSSNSPIENVSINPDLLDKVRGGERGSSGWICTISGECSIFGGSCNPFDKIN